MLFTRTAAAAIAAIAALGGGVAGAAPVDTWPLTHGIDCVADRFNPVRPDGTRATSADPLPGTPEWTAQQSERIDCSKQRDHDRRYQPADRLGTARYGEDWYRQPARFDGVRFRYSYLPADELSALGLGAPGVAAAEIYRPCAPGTCGSLPAGLDRAEPPYPVVAIWHGAIAQMSHHRFTAQALAEAGYLAILINGTAATGAPNFPDGAMGPALLDWLADDASGVFGREADLTRVGFVGHSAGAAAALTSQGDPRVDAFVAWDSNSAGDGITDENCLGGNPCAPIMYLRADGAFASGLGSTRDAYPEGRDWGLVPYRAHVQRGMDVFHVTFRAFSHVDYNGYGVGLGGNRLGELVINYYTKAWLDRHVMGALVVEGDEVVTSSGRSEAGERSFRQSIAADAYDRLIAMRFDDSADIHNVSMGFFDPVRLITSGDPVWGGNVPYTIEGLFTTDRLATDFRSYCSVSVPNYTIEDGPSVLARADTGDPNGAGPAGDMRIHGCPEVFRHDG